jgi:nucleoid-associated protein EbfC
MKDLQENLRRIKVEGSAGAGMVTVEANGQQQILSCRIDPALFSAGDREMVEDLVVGAVNQALERAKLAAAQEMSKVAGGLDMPGLNDALSQLGLDRGA